MYKSVSQAFSDAETYASDYERKYQEQLIKDDRDFQREIIQLKLEKLDNLAISISQLAESISNKKPPITINIFTNENTTPEQLEQIVAKFK